MVADDVAENRFQRQIATRFPPEPNGFPHIGHVKSICLNFGIKAEFAGRCNLRFDDTNPFTEDIKYVDAIKNDVKWLGFEWDAELYASDYFGKLYDFGELLVKNGKAYVDSESDDEIREHRGTVTTPGTHSPYRDRSVDENLDLLRRMKAGEFPDGAHVLRAKIDMSHPNMIMRDPLLLRIRHAHHYRQGDAWCLYPLYDFAHPLSDAIEGITHSLCTLEFKDNNDIYKWLVTECGFERPPEQTEFSRLELDYTVLSKRKLLRLVNEKLVSGWDDPRMPTLSGFRRRGVPAEAIRGFWERVGVAKRNSTIDVAMLEHAIREDLNRTAPRVMAVLRPLRLVIENYPEGQVEELDAVNNPEDASRGTRRVPFSRTLYIDREDFREVPPPKYFRLSPGVEVRLRYAYFVKCTNVVKDAAGNVTEVHCTYDPATKGGDAPDKRKVKATIHWVSAKDAVDAEDRLYDHLFTKPDPEDVPDGQDWKANLNPKSLEVLTTAKLEPSLSGASAGEKFQFERLGYFSVDSDSAPGKPVFNRTVGLRDTWAKIEKRAKA
jgi:glutaminyl-tRNA synthetase